MKQFVCVQVGHHREIASVIESYQLQGWRLHTYQAAHTAEHSINHYLLFESLHDVQPQQAWEKEYFQRSEA